MALLDVYSPEFWAQESLLQLFPRLRMAGLVYRNFEPIVAEKGDTVNTRIPGTLSARDANPDSFASTVPSATNVSIVLNKWKEVVFEIGDREASMSINDLLAEYITPAAEGIATAIEDSLMGLYADVYQTLGTAGDPPDSIALLGTDVKQRFDELLIPPENRNVVIRPALANSYNQLFYSASTSGDATQQTTGALGRKFGMDYYDVDRLPTHTAGDNDHAGAVDNGAGYAIGATTVHVDGFGLTKTFKAGDIIKHTDSGYEYVVTANATTDGTNGECDLTISPGLITEWADDDAVTSLASHGVNLCFHRQAFGLITRPLKVPGPAQDRAFTTSYKGIGIRSNVWYEDKDLRTYVRLDVLYGVKTLDPRKAFRLLS